MVFKPSELTPRTAVELGGVLREAGLPDGLFQVLQGGGDVGEALATHPRIAKVSLTGSVATGKRVMASASGTLKHLSLELGGKSPLIVFADADLRNAVSGAMLGNFYTQGEVCSNGTRVYVERPLYAAFIEQLLDRTARLRIGDPMDPETQVGSLISGAHLDKVLSMVERARADGASVLCGGEREPGLAGAFMRPTVLADCPDGCEAAREEIFGPVMIVSPFDDEDEVTKPERSRLFSRETDDLSDPLSPSFPG